MTDPVDWWTDKVLFWPLEIAERLPRGLLRLMGGVIAIPCVVVLLWATFPLLVFSMIREIAGWTKQ